MKNILVPIDFSKNSESAVKYALNLYKNEVCTFHFLHSTHFVNSTSRTYITPHYVKELYKNGLLKLQEFELRIKKEHANVKHDYKTIIDNKNLHVAIDNAIKKNKIELVIMATKGVTASVEYFAGSNTIEVINKVKYCPILVVPDNYTYATPKKIAFPTDYNRNYTNTELQTLKNILELYNSELSVLHINVEKELTESQQTNMQALKDYLVNQKHNFHFIEDNLKKAENIENFIKNFKIDILAMVHYKHGFIEDLVKEPVIKKLVFHPKTPILIIPR